jgi:WD40 repeat protein
MLVQFRPLFLAAILLFVATSGTGPFAQSGGVPRGAVALRHGGFVSAVLFTPDGKELITGSGDGLIRVWDARAGKEFRRLSAHQGGVLSLSLTRDGRTLASGGADKTARIWDLRAGKQLRQLSRGRGNIAAVALSPDGRLLAFAESDDDFLYVRGPHRPYT